MQSITDARGGELTADELLTAFTTHYLDVQRPYELVSFTHSAGEAEDRLVATLRADGQEVEITGTGNGPLAALVHGLAQRFGVDVHVRDYHEHAMSKGEDATAAAYVEADVDDEPVWGVGIHPSILTASLRAVVNAVNRAAALREAQEAAAAAFDPA